MGAFTCLTGEGDCWRPPAILGTSKGCVGDLEAGFGGTLGGVLWPSSGGVSTPSIFWGEKQGIPRTIQDERKIRKPLIFYLEAKCPYNETRKNANG